MRAQPDVAKVERAVYPYSKGLHNAFRKHDASHCNWCAFQFSFSNEFLAGLSVIYTMLAKKPHVDNRISFYFALNPTTICGSL